MPAKLVPTPEQRKTVEGMAAVGMREDDIAKVIGCSPVSLRKHYREELDTGHIKATAKVAAALYNKALGNGNQSVTACIFWMKTRAGWREPQDVNLGVTNEVSELLKAVDGATRGLPNGR